MRDHNVFKTLTFGNLNSPLPPEHVNVAASDQTIKRSIHNLFGFNKVPVLNPPNPTYEQCPVKYGGECGHDAAITRAEVAAHNLYVMLDRVSKCVGGTMVRLKIGDLMECWLLCVVVRAPAVQLFMLKFEELAGGELCVDMSGIEGLQVYIKTAHQVFLKMLSPSGCHLFDTFDVAMQSVKLDASSNEPRFLIDDTSDKFHISNTDKLPLRGRKRKAPTVKPSSRLPFGLKHHDNDKESLSHEEIVKQARKRLKLMCPADDEAEGDNGTDDEHDEDAVLLLQLDLLGVTK